jgi:hypothetical protein
MSGGLWMVGLDVGRVFAGQREWAPLQATRRNATCQVKGPWDWVLTMMVIGQPDILTFQIQLLGANLVAVTTIANSVCRPEPVCV